MFNVESLLPARAGAQRAGFWCSDERYLQIVDFLAYAMLREGTDLPVHPSFEAVLSAMFVDERTSPARIARDRARELTLREKREHDVVMLRPGTLFYMAEHGITTGRALRLDLNASFERPGKILTFR